jgi:hypothetical protein
LDGTPPRAVNLEENCVVPIGNDAISPRGAMTEIIFGFANPANPWINHLFTPPRCALSGSSSTVNYVLLFDLNISCKPSFSSDTCDENNDSLLSC